MEKEKLEAIIKEINNLEKIIIKSSITMFQNRLLKIVNDMEELKQKIILEEK